MPLDQEKLTKNLSTHSFVTTQVIQVTDYSPTKKFPDLVVLVPCPPGSWKHPNNGSCVVMLDLIKGNIPLDEYSLNCDRLHGTLLSVKSQGEMDDLRTNISSLSVNNPHYILRTMLPKQSQYSLCMEIFQLKSIFHWA